MGAIDEWMIHAIKHAVYHATNPNKNRRVKSNTEVVCTKNDNNEVIVEIFLFQNKIAEFNKTRRTFWLSNCGWHSKTTLRRLKYLLEAFTGKNERRDLVVYKGKWYEEHPMKRIVGRKRRRFDALTPTWDDKNGGAIRKHFVQACECCGEVNDEEHLCSFYTELPNVDGLVAYNIRSYLR